ncbi:inositol monophosphatase family protein [Streptomyces sp. TS71-3]|uniref:inositol monophosphatase family protein n=1 Tax=Streptomyces sp. TS71-3 TaxID=2733862 RepID=UPI001B101E27|nr:inositol monophosphatase family protein [Streptomyces sp. TS71-3]GHJ40644.1 inositol monophosphatase [Streptomyces sp. TS71-3]
MTSSAQSGQPDQPEKSAESGRTPRSDQSTQSTQSPQPGPAERAERDELLALAKEAARRAGTLLRDGRPADLGVAATKSSPIDVVTEMDIAAEKLITGFLGEHRPADGFLGEEGASRTGTSGVRWVIDPLDGTVNYLYGLPTWSVSIAAERDGETVVGVVEVPMRGETFHAVLGGGAYAGEQRLRCRADAPLEQSLVATGFNYVTTVRDHQAEVARQLVPQVRDIRRGGSAAVDLCDLAAGRLDAYFERGLNPWDMAAGDLIAREAGALTGGRPGERPSYDLALAATPGVFAPLQRILDELGAWHD